MDKNKNFACNIVISANKIKDLKVSLIFNKTKEYKKNFRLKNINNLTIYILNDHHQKHHQFFII